MSEATHDVGIVGLGYVGLTLATAMADVGYKLVGLERRPEVVDLLKAGKPHFQEVGLDHILKNVIAEGRLAVREQFDPSDRCDAYIITVGTPLDANGMARLDMIESATRQVADSMPDDALVILRSTVKVGTSRNVVAPILAASGKRFKIAMCPERTLEGNAMQELRQLPQIIGADDTDTRERAARLFSKLTKQVLTVSSLEAAEVIKLADNTFRDVRFAFANEIARLCDAVGVSANEVIGIGKLGYSRTNIALPGLVGGPCLEKDPHILRQSAHECGIELEITRAAREVNERQPLECAKWMVSELERRNIADAPTVSFLGLAFKGVPEADDLRGAMSLHVIRHMRDLLPDAKFKAYDPVVSAKDIEALNIGLEVCDDLKGALHEVDLAVITNNHPKLASIGFSTMVDHLSPDGFVYDFWNHFSEVEEEDATDRRYFAVGSIRRRPN